MRKLRLLASSLIAGAALTAAVAAVATPAANATTISPAVLPSCDTVQATPPTPDGGHGPAICSNFIGGSPLGQFGACKQFGDQMVAQGHIGSYTCNSGRGPVPLTILTGFGH